VNRPLPFAWISCVGEKGGAETLMIECVRALDRSQFEPHVIQLRPGPLEAQLREIDVRVHVLRQHRMREVHRIVEAIAQIRTLTDQHEFRLLHSNGFRAHVYGGLAALWAGVPEVWTGHTFEQPSWSTRAILAIPTRHVLANCPRTADFYRPRVNAPVSVVWPGVNVAVL
jgi:Glycosyltransferase Family 4